MIGGQLDDVSLLDWMKITNEKMTHQSRGIAENADTTRVVTKNCGLRWVGAQLKFKRRTAPPNFIR